MPPVPGTSSIVGERPHLPPLQPSKEVTSARSRLHPSPPLSRFGFSTYRMPNHPHRHQADRISAFEEQELLNPSPRKLVEGEGGRATYLSGELQMPKN